MPNTETNHNITVHRWGPEYLKDKPFTLLDTTLRDGVQAPRLKQPTLEEKLAIIDFDGKIGIEAVDICMPGTGGRWYQEGIECAKYMKDTYPDMQPTVLTRTTKRDVESTIRFAKEADVNLSAILFRGSSDLRLLAEGWNEEQVVEDMYNYSKQLTENGISVVAATEDTTRTRPDFLRQVFLAGRDGGAREFCIADTVGYADAYSTEAIASWVKKEIVGDRDLKIQFHGHEDTGQSSSNSLAALKGGADTVHVTWLGIGERAGNTDLGEILAQLNVHNINKYDLTSFMNGSEFVSQVTGRPIPVDKVLVGKHVYTTSVGIHAAGIDKARQLGRNDIAERVYNAVPASAVGRDIKVNIGPMSGEHNLTFNNIKDPVRGELLLLIAKRHNRELEDQEISDYMASFESKDNEVLMTMIKELRADEECFL